MTQFKCFNVCKTHGLYARVLPLTINYSKSDEFEGLAMPIIVRDGRSDLNSMLKTGSKGRVVVIDATHLGRTAVFGRQEAASARAGGARAVVVLGLVAHVSALESERIPIRAFGATPRMLPADGGSAHAAMIDTDCGLLTTEDYIVGDSDGVVAVELERYQQSNPIK